MPPKCNNSIWSRGPFFPSNNRGRSPVISGPSYQATPQWPSGPTGSQYRNFWVDVQPKTPCCAPRWGFFSYLGEYQHLNESTLNNQTTNLIPQHRVKIWPISCWPPSAHPLNNLTGVSHSYRHWRGSNPERMGAEPHSTKATLIKYPPGNHPRLVFGQWAAILVSKQNAWLVLPEVKVSVQCSDRA